MRALKLLLQNNERKIKMAKSNEQQNNRNKLSTEKHDPKVRIITTPKGHKVRIVEAGPDDPIYSEGWTVGSQSPLIDSPDEAEHS